MAEQTALIGRRIAEARDAANLTQAELAAKIPGKSDGTQVSKWERGVHRPSDDTLEHIAGILERDYVWFLTPDAPEILETPDLFGTAEPSQLDRIERLLNELLDRLVADGILRAVEQDDQQEQPQAPSKHRRRAS